MLWDQSYHHATLPRIDLTAQDILINASNGLDDVLADSTEDQNAMSQENSTYVYNGRVLRSRVKRSPLS